MWRKLQVQPPAAGNSLWSTAALPRLLNIWHVGLAAVLLANLESKNDLVFNAKILSSTEIIRRVADDILLWSGRFCAADRPLLERLRAFLVNNSV